MIPNYTINSVYHIARADFLQRIRSYHFLIALGICVFLIYSFVPPLGSNYVIVSLGNYRGFYNSAWIGGMVASCVPFFALIGFYLVNYAVKRDEDTGVGQIIATTRINKVQYLSGKLMSNFAVFLVMLLVIAAMTLIMFLIRGETGHIEFGKLVLPLLFLVAPSLFITACIALFFDSLTSLNRGVVNILYFFLWTFLISITMISPLLDILGGYVIMPEIRDTLSALHADWNGNHGTGIMVTGSTLNNKIFVWKGMTWTASLLLLRLFWMAASFGLVILASFGFNRFDTSRASSRAHRMPVRIRNKSFPVEDKAGLPSIQWQHVPLPETRFRFFSIIKAEIRLMVRGKTKSGLIVTVILFSLSIFTPLNFAYQLALPLLWFFQILTLSEIGCREIKNRCSEYIFSAAFPLRRQLPATLSAAILFMLLLALPVALRLLMKGDLYHVYAIMAGAVFIPVFAITLGILTGGSKFFEVIFTVITYVYFNEVPLFDFTGAIDGSRELGIPNYLLMISLLLIILAFGVRKRQIRGT
jgi:hypothetical protein